MRRTRLGYSFALALAAAGCEAETTKPTRAQLLDPEFCKDCHPQHYEEWSASMHAYASRDPVFLAMNKRGQEEAEIGEFCVQCHAPMALREGAIDDFADLTDLPKHLQGVTCYFCHNAVKVNEPHSNANIELANDTIMRGALSNPIDTPAHGVAAKPSALHDRYGKQSSKLCGACHDIVNPLGLQLENTFREYAESAQANTDDPGSFDSCQSCHMRIRHRSTPAAPGFEGAHSRQVTWHLFPAVDVSLTPDMPHQDALRSAVEHCELQYRTRGGIAVERTGEWQTGEHFSFRVALEHLCAHNLPSGATADRRMWLEITAYDEAGRVVLESGKIADGELEEKPPGTPGHDPQLHMFRDYLVDAEGHETHMFWDAAEIRDSRLIPFTKANDPSSHTAYRSFTTDERVAAPPTRIEIKWRLRPMGVDVLQDLVQSGHLDPAVIDAMPTYTIAHVIARLLPDGSYKVDDHPDFDEAGCEEFPELLEASMRRR